MSNSVRKCSKCTTGWDWQPSTYCLPESRSYYLGRTETNGDILQCIPAVSLALPVAVFRISGGTSLSSLPRYPFWPAVQDLVLSLCPPASTISLHQCLWQPFPVVHCCVITLIYYCSSVFTHPLHEFCLPQPPFLHTEDIFLVSCKTTSSTAPF